MATKEQAQAIDTAFEEAVAKVAPIVTTLNAGLNQGSPADCYLLSGWADLIAGAGKINKAKALIV